MGTVLDELVAMLALERIEDDLFRGQTQDLGWGTVFGGHVLGQALSAASQTVPADRHVHSLHSYFLRRGDVTRPILYEVDRIRDGSSFTTRRVIAVQRGRAIFTLATSFQKEQPGFEHQDEMPQAPPPESLKTEQERLAVRVHELDERVRKYFLAVRPFELRPTDPDDPFDTTPRPARRKYWLKAIDRLPDDRALHDYLLAYASDHAFMTTALLPHGIGTWFTPGMQVASLDHAMWFHRRFRVDEWLLYDMESPAAGGARGLVRGRVFARDGQLVATVAQEGLIRRRS